ncbi:ribonuclease III [bacterium]|nr:ribonuclease III [bacterium]
MKDFSELENKLDIKFKNKDLLVQAFCHRSYLNENPKFHLGNNERLEFLGDAVLELIVTEYLYKNFNKPEGDLTSWRAALVNTKSLSSIASEIGFGDYVLLSKGELEHGGKRRKCILADVFEAFLGALYLDQGLDKARKFIEENLIKNLERILKEKSWIDPKSMFQQKAQEKMKLTPVYKVIKEFGPDHEKQFVVGVFLENKLIAQGCGFSKQEAEEEAAARALKEKKWN